MSTDRPRRTWLAYQSRLAFWIRVTAIVIGWSLTFIMREVLDDERGHVSTRVDLFAYGLGLAVTLSGIVAATLVDRRRAAH